MFRNKIVLILLVFTISGAASDEGSLTVNLDWSLGIRGGVEYRLNRTLGFKADIGLAMLMVPALDLFGVLYLLPPENRLRLNLLFGIPNLMMPFEFDPLRLYAMVSFGGSVVFGYWFGEKFAMDLRIGGSFPLFLGEKDKPMVRPLNFPLLEDTFLRFMWPDLALTLNFRI